MRLTQLRAATLATAVGLSSVAPATAQTPSVGPDTFPLRHSVTGSTIRVGLPNLTSLTAAAPFKYAGGHRFILSGVADAEQHAFVEADANGRVSRFYWIQFEAFLPTITSRYNYEVDSAITRGAIEWRVQPRSYAAPPDPASDRGALYALLRKSGFEPPVTARRVRLVYLPTPDRRSEVMIIYAETTESAAQMTGGEVRALLDRAFGGLQVR